MLIRWSDKLPVTTAAGPVRLATLASTTGREPTFVRLTGSGEAIYDLGAPLGRDAATILEDIGQMPGVVAVEPDLWMTADAPPNDEFAEDLWGLLGAADGSAYGIDAGGAWGTTTGEGVVVAVIDTGLVAHADLAGQAVTGYDMISDVETANDGNGRDSNASDPGDWSGPGDPCPAENSSWHGTHVAGTIAALANNGIGVFGGAPGVKIQPVRVLGVCGGFLSDIADGIRWAAGGTVSGVAPNPTPARVLNLSLGGTSPCTAYLSNAISDARSRGAVVVVSAGNEQMDASNATPANCNGVITVAAIGQAGLRASFSNYGNVVEIAGPGVSIRSTIDSGATAPAGSHYANYSGTSMAAPHVALTAALVAAAAPTLTPDEIGAVLAGTSTPFAPDGSPSGCAARGCGVGIVHAARAVSAAAGAVYVPLTPARLLDSRIGNGLSNTFKTGIVRTFDVAGRGGVPVGAVAVTGNLTVTGQTSAGFVSVGPTMSSSPTTSTLNAPVGDNRANGLTVELSSTGKLAAVWSGAPGSTTHLIFDVTGYFTGTAAGAVYVPLTPARLLDSRIGNGLSNTFKTGIVRTFDVAGRGGVPVGAVAVTGNLTVTGQTSAGFVSVGPTMSSSPTTSTLNAPVGDNRANGLTVELSATGKLAAVWSGAPGSTTHLIFDVTGYFTGTGAGAVYVPLTPARLLDSRIGNGLSNTFKTGIVRTFDVAGRGGVPVGAVAVTGNLTVTGQTSAGFVSVGPTMSSSPTTSTLNAPVGDNRANGLTVELSATGKLAAVWSGAPGSTTHLIFDVTGYFR